MDSSVFDTPAQLTFCFLFADGTKELTIQIVSQNDLTSVVYEKTGDDIELYKRNGIEHHIVDNEEAISIVWFYKNYECVIAGDFTVENARKIIYSIYER